MAISHGEKEEDKRVYVFPDGKGPNHLESNYLRLGGTGLTIFPSISLSPMLSLLPAHALSRDTRQTHDVAYRGARGVPKAREVCKRRARCANSLAGGDTRT